MGPQTEDGYTKIANELLDALYRIRIPGESMQIFLMILRKTYGYGKKSDRIALSQFTETGIRKSHIQRAISKLVEMKIIHQNGSRHTVVYSINKHHEEWIGMLKKTSLVPQNGNEIPQNGNSAEYPKMGTLVPQNGNEIPQNGNSSTPKWGPQKKKETLTKETIQKKGSMLPICESWVSFMAMRKSIKKPLTDKAMELAVKKLEVLQKTGNDPVAVLDQSTFNSWQGLFEIKGDKDGSRNFGSAAKAGRQTESFEDDLTSEFLAHGDGTRSV